MCKSHGACVGPMELHSNAPDDGFCSGFCSFRFGIANGEPEARVTKQALEARGVSVFLSHAVGVD